MRVFVEGIGPGFCAGEIGADRDGLFGIGAGLFGVAGESVCSGECGECPYFAESVADVAGVFETSGCQCDGFVVSAEVDVDSGEYVVDVALPVVVAGFLVPGECGFDHVDGVVGVSELVVCFAEVDQREGLADRCVDGAGEIELLLEVSDGLVGSMCGEMCVAEVAQRTLFSEAVADVAAEGEFDGAVVTGLVQQADVLQIDGEVAVRVGEGPAVAQVFGRFDDFFEKADGVVDVVGSGEEVPVQGQGESYAEPEVLGGAVPGAPRDG